MSTPSTPRVPDPPGSPIPAVSARALLSDAEFNAVLGTILSNNPGMAIEMGGRILTQALALVATAASRPGRAMTPSRVVDEGWHTLILHTELYWRLCTRFGNFVHHIPEQPDPGRYDQHVIGRTTALIEAAGTRSTAICGVAPRTRSCRSPRNASTATTAGRSSPSRSRSQRASLTGMAKEWIDPRYAELVTAWKREQMPSSRDPQRRPVKAFIIPPKA